MRRVGNLVRFSGSRSLIELPWKSRLRPLSDLCWASFGKSIVDSACAADTGEAAFMECREARTQLDMVIRSIGYDIDVCIFGGLTILGVLEVGGDVDFAGVLDVEPSYAEASSIIARISHELRRYGLRTCALPKARVPVVKADRVSKCLPGAAKRMVTSSGVFRFVDPLLQMERCAWQERLRSHFGALNVQWDGDGRAATVQFRTTTDLISALTQVSHHKSNEAVLRVPLDVRNGPELYRFPFDFCLSSTGLRNSLLFSEALAECIYGRHLLLALKRWGRASGIVNSIDGMLASYALTVMLTHFLIQIGAVSKIMAPQIVEEPHLLCMNPSYRALATTNECPLNEVGYVLAAFFEYYGSVFDYEKSVVCTTNMTLTKESMRWCDTRRPHLCRAQRLPFFGFCIKDPYSLDNIARNVDAASVRYIRQAHCHALDLIEREHGDLPFALKRLLHDPPRPAQTSRSLVERGIHSDVFSPDQLEARHVLHKHEFHERKKKLESFGRRAAQHNEEQNAATKLARSVLGWIHSDDEVSKRPGRTVSDDVAPVQTLR